MKDIKDYLHLYIGFNVRVYVFTDESITDGFLSKYIEDYPNGVYNPILTFENYNRFIKDGYKPILRPLSEMKEEEFSAWVSKSVGDPQDATVYFAKTEADKTKYLLSKHFDLFGLIEAGLAIDKTKMTNTIT